MLKPSVSAGIALVRCPACQFPQDEDETATATVGHDDGPRASCAYLEAFACPSGHTLKDLTPAMEGIVLSDALDWLFGAREALESAADDAAYDRWRDDGR